jgi:hypothetical protein
MTARLVAYAPNGARLGILPEPLEWAASTAAGEFGGLTLSYAAAAAGADLLKGRRLDAGLELAVEVWTGSAWVEPEGARYIALRRGRDQADPAAVLHYTATGYGWITTKIKHLAPSESMYAPPGENEGQRLLTGTPGAIVTTLLAEYATRGGPAIARTFTAASSSKGAAWAGTVELWVGRGEALDAILDRLAVAADLDHWWEGRSLCMAATRPGVDRSATVVLRLGTHVTEAPSEDAIEELISVHTLHGGDGVIQTTTAVEAPKPWGRWEGFASDDRITTAGAATAQNQQILADAARERSSYTHDLVESTDLVIGHHVKVGDWVTAPGHDVLEQLRIAGLQWRFGADGLVQTLILNDRLLNAELRRLKRERTGESKGATGTGSTIGSPGQDRRTPAKTTGVTASSYSYITATGGARAGILIDWTAVNQAAPEHGGGLMVIERYEVGYRPGTSGTWLIVPFTAKPADLSDLPVNASYQLKVRARGQYSTSPGHWSDVVSIVTAKDTTPPPVPSAPTVTTARGVATISWDGKTNAGAAQPADFSHCVLEWDGVSVITGNAVAGTDRLTGRGAISIPALKPGTTARARLSAVDRSGNASTFTTWVTVSVSSVLDDTGLAERLAGIDGEVAAAKADAAAAQSEATSASGRTTISTTDPVAADGDTRPIGAVWEVRSGATVLRRWLLTAKTPAVWTQIRLGQDMVGENAIGSAQIGEVDAALIKSGFIDTARLQAGSILTEKLVVASASNMIPWQPARGVAPHAGAAGTTLDAINEPYYGWSFHPSGGTGSAGTWGSCIELRPEKGSRRGDSASWDVMPGESYRLRIGFGMRGTWSAAVANRKVRVALVFMLSSGSAWTGTAVGNEVSPVVDAAGALRYSEVIGTVPAGCVRMRVYVQRLYGNDTSMSLWIADPTLVPATDGSLTVENSITGKHLFVDEAFMTKLKAGFAEFDTVLVGSIKATMIDVTDLTVRRLKTNPVTNRGVVIQDDEILIYDSSGNLDGRLASVPGTPGARVWMQTMKVGSSGWIGDYETGTQFGRVNGAQSNSLLAFGSNTEMRSTTSDRQGRISASGARATLELRKTGRAHNIAEFTVDDGINGRGIFANVRNDDPSIADRLYMEITRSKALFSWEGSGGLEIEAHTEPSVRFTRGDNAAGAYLYATSAASGELGIRLRPAETSSSGQTFWYMSNDGRLRSVVNGVTRNVPFAIYANIISLSPAAADTTYTTRVNFTSGVFTKTPTIALTPRSTNPTQRSCTVINESSTGFDLQYRSTSVSNFACHVLAFQDIPT